MRIAFDHQTFTHQTYGGISRYFAQLGQGLINCEQQVKIFAPLHRNSYLESLPRNIINGRRINKYPPKTTRFFAAYNDLVSRHQIAQWRPDVVHETYYSKRGTSTENCPTVITVHDMIHELFANEFPKNDNTISIKKNSIERADHVICISENTKNDLINLYATPANKISVILHGFDKFIEDEDKNTILNIEARPFLLYVGSRSGYKNFSGFIKAVAASKKLLSNFDIVAFGGSKFSDHERFLINSLGFIENQVRHTGGNDLLLGEYYRAARAFIYPSLYEGFGIPPLEAMAHNCPVISSNTSSIPEVIGDAGEYFNPYDVDDMRFAIERVACSDGRIQCLQELGKERLSYFSWNKCVQETLNVYRSVI